MAAIPFRLNSLSPHPNQGGENLEDNKMKPRRRSVVGGKGAELSIIERHSTTFYVLTVMRERRGSRPTCTGRVVSCDCRLSPRNPCCASVSLACLPRIQQPFRQLIKGRVGCLSSTITPLDMPIAEVIAETPPIPHNTLKNPWGRAQASGERERERKRLVTNKHQKSSSPSSSIVFPFLLSIISAGGKTCSMLKRINEPYYLSTAKWRGASKRGSDKSKGEEKVWWSS